MGSPMAVGLGAYLTKIEKYPVHYRRPARGPGAEKPHRRSNIRFPLHWVHPPEQVRKAAIDAQQVRTLVVKVRHPYHSTGVACIPCPSCVLVLLCALR